MKFLQLLFAIALCASTGASALDLNNALNRITTPVAVSVGQQQSQATAFFYVRLAPPEDPAKTGPQWRVMQDIWLVTNRHVILPRNGDQELVPDAFSFHLRKIVENHLEWETLVLSREQILERARFHSDPSVDVAVVRVKDLIVDRIKEEGLRNF